MLIALMCLLILVNDISGYFESIKSPLNAQVISIGISPFSTEQAAETESPEFAVSALKEIGPNCGPTEFHTFD